MFLKEEMDMDDKNHIEKILLRGFTIVKDAISPESCKIISEKLDYLEELQRKEYGFDRLKALNEIGIVRAPIEKDDYFSNLILNQKVFQIVSALIGDTAILHLQNGIILSPNLNHGQAHYHRDITFLNFTSDKIFSISALYAIDDFTEENGGTWVVPYTHKMSEWPSEKYLEENSIQIVAKAGSVIILDSMLIHKGAQNRSNHIRRAVNHMFTRPVIKQQIDFTSIMKGKFDMESKMSQVLGFWSIPPKSVAEYRADPDKRTYRKGQ